MNNKYYDEVEEIANLIGIKLASINEILSVYPDEFLGSKFYEMERNGSKEARAKFSKTFQKQLIKAFNSHEWKVYSDIYGHDGLSSGGNCKKCKRKFKFPRGEYTDDFILAYHYVYGRQKRFGGRIIMCK